jgi:hypothetical protein
MAPRETSGTVARTSAAAAADDVIRFNNSTYSSWRQARDAYNSVSAKCKPGSVWLKLKLVSADPDNYDLPFRLRCKDCDTTCQLMNPAKFKREQSGGLPRLRGWGRC